MIIKYSYEEFKKDINKIMRYIKQEGIKFNTIIAIARGGLVLGVKLSHKLDTPLMVISARSYNNQHKQENLMLNTSFTRPISSPVLIVDDIVDSGNTLQMISNYVSAIGVECKSTTLCYKDKSIFHPTWYCRKIRSKDWVKFFWE